MLRTLGVGEGCLSNPNVSAYGESCHCSEEYVPFPFYRRSPLPTHYWEEPKLSAQCHGALPGLQGPPSSHRFRFAAFFYGCGYANG